MDSVVHFEIPASDTKRATEFYEKSFGWKSENMPEMKYVILRTTKIDKKTKWPIEPGAINGGMMERNSKIKSPVITISVKNMDKSLKEVIANGGSVFVKKIAVGNMGFASYIKDTEGNVIGLFEPTKM